MSGRQCKALMKIERLTVCVRLCLHWSISLSGFLSLLVKIAGIWRSSFNAPIDKSVYRGDRWWDNTWLPLKCAQTPENNLFWVPSSQREMCVQIQQWSKIYIPSSQAWMSYCFLALNDTFECVFSQAEWFYNSHILDWCCEFTSEYSDTQPAGCSTCPALDPWLNQPTLVKALVPLGAN